MSEENAQAAAPPLKKEYLGDGVYIENQGYYTVLTTENGIETNNTIYLEPQVLANLVRYAQQVLNREM